MDFKRNRGELGTEGNHLSPTELKDGGGHYRTRLQTNFQQERIRLTTKRRVGKWLLFLHPPGHSFPTQSIVSLKSPSQYFPPWSGAGLVHVLFRKLVPLPHGLEHRVQSDQFENPPLTVNKEHFYCCLFEHTQIFETGVGKTWLAN